MLNNNLNSVPPDNRNSIQSRKKGVSSSTITSNQWHCFFTFDMKQRSFFQDLKVTFLFSIAECSDMRTLSIKLLRGWAIIQHISTHSINNTYLCSSLSQVNRLPGKQGQHLCNVPCNNPFILMNKILDRFGHLVIFGLTVMNLWLSGFYFFGLPFSAF